MIYIANPSEPFDMAEAFSAVSEQRRSHALRYKKESDRRLSLVAYRLLQHALREEYGIVQPPLFDYDAGGKPSLVGHPEIFFSLSHCSEAVACVVSSMPVGIDVESIDSYDTEMVAVVMNGEEQRQIASSSDARTAFITLWTQKESLYKMTGETAGGDVRQLLSTSPSLREGVAAFHTTASPRFVCTLCHHVADEAVRTIHRAKW